MSERPVTIMSVQMKALARYEETFDKYIDAEAFDEGKLAFPEKYQMTLEDLYAAVSNILEKDPTVEEFGKYWYYPLSVLEDTFGITKACEVASLDNDTKADQTLVRGLPLTEEDVFSEVWGDLGMIWTYEKEDTHLAELSNLKESIFSIEIFLANRDKPVSEREFTDDKKESFIRYCNNAAREKTASELELELCRKFTDELCEKDCGTALHLKGYACYGGNRLYECDWTASRDCIIRLYEKTDDPVYANTLGYIYYYGRCTGGNPEYEKALEMFSVAAANGLHEGIYKLADMFRHGYACKKSPRTARALYGMAYDDCYEKFFRNPGGNFADAALRMGNVYLNGIGEDVSPQTAYGYYLQADFAVKQRARNSDFFGDTTVAINIQKAFEETRTKLPEDFFSEYIEMIQPWIFWGLLEEGYRAGITFKNSDDGSVSVEVRRIPKRTENGATPILLTCPEIDYCGFVTGIELTAIGLDTSFDLGAGKEIKYDSCEWNPTDWRIDFYYDEDMVGWISCEEYRFYRRKKETPSGEQLTLVSVAFGQGDKTYDYICELTDVKVGDRVIVIGYDGETEAEVRAVYIRYESELALPIERYKRVVRKV